MNVNSLLASLLSTPAAATNSASAASSAAPSDPSSGVQFKAQYSQAVAALTQIVDSANGTAGSNASASATSSANASTAAQQVTDALQAQLQKKISDLLAAGATVSEVVQQLAGALATAFPTQFGGNTAQIQTQLQTVFASALSPPGNGPPASLADLASTLAQQYRQIADLAAGVIGETGQSNRLFAGSFSDAATTAGGQPAPTSTSTGTTADSTATDASALLANLTASQGDGKTVASSAPMIGTNGDTLLGRILARATQLPSPQVTAPAGTATSSTAAAAVAPGTPNPASGLADRAIVAATALLASSAQATTTGPAAKADPDPNAAATAMAGSASGPNAIWNALSAEFAKKGELTGISDVSTSPASGTSSTALASASATTDASATAPSLPPAVTAFINAFTGALAANSSPALPATTPEKTADDGTATVLPTSVASAQAPTIGAFAPVQPAQTVDASSANQTSPSLPPQHPAPTDPNTVIEQVLRGAFLSTTGTSSTVRLKLVPEELGDVNVRLAINGSSVDASVVAQTPAAHDALVAGQAQLTRSLSDAGMKLTSFNVSLAGGFASFQQHQQQQQPSGQQQAYSGRQLLLGDVDTPETDDASLSAIPSFAPPSATATTGWGAYNYLV